MRTAVRPSLPLPPQACWNGEAQPAGAWTQLLLGSQVAGGVVVAAQGVVDRLAAFLGVAEVARARVGVVAAQGLAEAARAGRGCDRVLATNGSRYVTRPTLNAHIGTPPELLARASST